MSSSQQLVNITYRHKALADLMIRNPELQTIEMARMLGLGEKQIYVITGSDAFQEYFALRRIQHEERLSSSVIERVETLAHDTLDVMSEKIEKERDTLPLSVLNDVAKTALTALGHGVKAGAPVVHGDVNIGIDQELLSRARGRMKTVREVEGEGKVIENDPSANEALRGADLAVSAAE